ncbi:MAG: PIN domain-containing protein [Candidatus Pacebacteria bacterium]|nr:PIN domain-containing protein [Candidatus Paceibacterota bacterium]
MDESIEDRIKNKHLILDTNVLINASKYQEKYFDFFDLLNKLDVKLVIDDSVKFEFLRGASTKENLLKNEDFLSKLNKAELIVTKEIFEMAREISNIYVRNIRNSTQKISFVDCLIAGQMEKFNEQKEQLFFATENNTDFPLLLFDRIYILLIWRVGFPI